ncbi:MAG: tRNA preQ1(34) S-adenosylmethionine ribosyltransferase-isomerase QueA [Alphaproteobacteria bacterium]|nr:tRNA preQ1(34) S-adenosylmethionine ribosyltransferase-isomerase QueA [Alphaproteobacteria bacterium]
MRTEDFDFELPRAAIADRPAVPRDHARLLEVAGTLADRTIRDIPTLVRPGDVMVFNDTRVIPARLLGRRGEVEVECLLHQERSPGRWLAFARPAKRLKPDQTVTFSEDLSARVVGKTDDGLIELEFRVHGPAFMAMIERIGHVPLPPYIDRPDDARDRTDYQTAYAVHDGAIAAPTAGLHFTPALLDRIDAAGATRVHVTLHVGAGTFLPVKTDDPRQHRMHAEHGWISESAATAINRARAAGGRVIAVGTTSARLLETAAKKDGTIDRFADDSSLFIMPGYRFKLVDVLMTNFHLPKSTLFMLVSAFAGLDRMQGAYRHAISNGYRFYSYGDACWLHRASPQ